MVEVVIDGFLGGGLEISVVVDVGLVVVIVFVNNICVVEVIFKMVC